MAAAWILNETPSTPLTTVPSLFLLCLWTSTCFLVCMASLLVWGTYGEAWKSVSRKRCPFFNISTTKGNTCHFLIMGNLSGRACCHGSFGASQDAPKMRRMYGNLIIWHFARTSLIGYERAWPPIACNSVGKQWLTSFHYVLLCCFHSNLPSCSIWNVSSHTKLSFGIGNLWETYGKTMKKTTGILRT